MPLVTTQQWANRDRAVWDWTDAQISGPSGSEKGLPRLGIVRWMNDRIGIQVPNVTAKVDAQQKGEHDWEFTLGAKAKIRFRYVDSIWMPEGPAFEPEAGALQVNFLFDAKPSTNVFPVLLSLPAGCRMEYQPELTAEEKSGNKAVGPSTRPPWCVHSFAAYSAGGRKLGHLPRPFAYSTKNLTNYVWGEWQWNQATGTLAKVIPQAWLDSLGPGDFPIIVDDTFGQTSVGGSGASAAADMIGGHGPYSPGSDGTLDSVSFYAAADESGTPTTLGLYNDNSGTPAGGALVDDSAGGNGPGGAGWCTQNMDGSESILAANSYWFGRFHDTNPWAVRYDASGSIDWFYKSETYSGGTLPDPFPAGPSKLDFEVSIYGTYTPAAAGAAPTAHLYGSLVGPLGGPV